MASLKDAKEAFVSGHKGTNPLEILLVCSSAPIGIFLFQEVRAAMSATRRRDEMLNKSAMLILLESTTILLPMAICQTVLLHPYGVVLLIAEVSLGLVLHTYTYSQNKRKKDRDVDLTQKGNTQLDFLTFYRSTVSYLTFIAILAVDFTVFPRSFAKTEVSGYGLMDLGAGSFCVSGGFVSCYARRRGEESKKESEKVKGKPQLHKVLIKSIPLLVMGFIRLATTKGLEYQEHVSEYGVHWNFFFTLAFVGILSTLIRSTLNMCNPFATWIPMIFCYQVLLSHSLQNFIESAPRAVLNGSTSMNFLYANREGILGCTGYLILHLASEDIAHYCLWGNNSFIARQREQLQGRRLFLAACLSWTLLGALTNILNVQVSRRSCNISFILWTISHNMTILSLTWLSFYLGCSNGKGDRDKGNTNPPIFAAVNQHGLIVFILANLMTGVVNLSINTLEASYGKAIVVIFVYLCCVGAVALLMDVIFPARKKKKAS
mmetsp:Transcript_19467/g.28679  ORF Transcript_19467/g.28679 Transcript_19467/m.28679 type:complete len:490 (+) Transcript_19467:121-1590(+)